MSATGIRDLGARLASAGEDAFRDCYAELAPMLRRYLRGRVPDADIEDVVQVVFVELWRFRGRYDARRSLEAWVLTIARRRAIDHLRSRHREVLSLDDAAAMPGPDGRDIAGQVEQARDVQAGRLTGATYHPGVPDVSDKADISPTLWGDKWSLIG